MDDQENDGSCVSWGREISNPSDLDELKNTKLYSSFHLNGITYHNYDTVYLPEPDGPDGPPRIAKIVKLSEKFPEKEKKMSVRWFLRNFELPARVAGVDRKADSKEIFLSWNPGRSRIVSPASTIGKCSVLCTSPLPWNTPFPTREMIDSADYMFGYAYDTTSCQLVTLDLVVDKFGKGYCKGLSARIPVAVESNVGSPRKAVEPGTEAEAKANDPSKLDPVRLGGSSKVPEGQKSLAELIAEAKKVKPIQGPDTRPVILETQRLTDSSGLSSEPPISLSQRLRESPSAISELSNFIRQRETVSTGLPTEPGNFKRREADSSGSSSEPPVSQSQRLRDSPNAISELGILKRQRETVSTGLPSEPGNFKRRETDSTHLNLEPGISKQRQATSLSSPSLSERPKNISAYKPSGATTGKIVVIDLLDDELKGKQMPDLGATPSPPVPTLVNELDRKQMPSPPVPDLDKDRKGKQMPDRVTPCPPVPTLVNELNWKQMPSPPVPDLDKDRKGKQMPDRVTPSPPVPTLNNEQKRKQMISPVTKFINMPWHKILEMAYGKRTVLRLQNLDPWFSSAEIEETLTKLLGVSCEARMLPPKDFSSYTSGEALVLFPNVEAADDAYAKFTENVLCLSTDQRPVVVSRPKKNMQNTDRFRGFLDLDKYNLRSARLMQKESGGATAHCAQPNTVAFEMGMQWRLTQERQTAAWKLAANQQSKMPRQARSTIVVNHLRLQSLAVDCCLSFITQHTINAPENPSEGPSFQGMEKINSRIMSQKWVIGMKELVFHVNKFPHLRGLVIPPYWAGEMNANAMK